MATKIRDLAVKLGEYTDRDGNTKGRYQNIGAMMKGDDGNEFIILHRWFSPAGVPNPDSRDSVLVSCFRVRDQQGGGSAPAQTPPTREAPAQDYGDDIPFITSYGIW